ncbi:MAG: UDP-N-acetylmuramoyl-tripeptide--D-alanyl-D-alanine ligase, partial [Flavobacteriaceae bacterium]
PNSMRAALENLHELEGTGKVVILGDMFELGNSAEKEHQIIADLASSLDVGTVFLIGNHFHTVKAHHNRFRTFEDFKNYFKGHRLPEKSTLLIKGSRGMALERILKIL